MAREPSDQEFSAEWLALKRVYPRQPGQWRKEIAALLRTKQYSDAEIEGAQAAAQAQAAEIAASLREDGVELDEVGAQSDAIAVIAYLQSLGRAVKEGPVATASLGGAR